jgi:hypothetical protein
MIASPRIDQLHVDQNLFTGLLHAAFEDSPRHPVAGEPLLDPPDSFDIFQWSVPRSIKSLKFMGDAVLIDPETICAIFGTAKSNIK